MSLHLQIYKLPGSTVLDSSVIDARRWPIELTCEDSLLAFSVN